MNARNQVRRIVVPAATSTASFLGQDAARNQDFDLTQFLVWLATSTGAGVAVYWTIEFAEKLLRQGIAPTVKFYLGMGLSFVYPLGAYLLTVYFGWQEWSTALLFAAIVVGYTTSQGIHWETVPAPKPEAPK